MARALLAVAVIALLAGGGPAFGASGTDTFRMPSGNIYCAYEHYDFAPIQLRCEIRSGVKPLPPRPASCRDGDWGAGYSLRQTGQARVLCITDTVYDPRASVFAYWTTRLYGAFRCSSSPAGLRCTNTSGHGFFLSVQHSYAFRTAPARNGAFKTPSGNIVCGYSAVASAADTFVECGIKSGLRPPPKAIQCDAGDPVGNRIGLRGTGRATVVRCAGDPGPLLPEVQAKAAVLPYGTTKRIGAITCTSQTTGLTCRNASGHGFFLSRERSHTF